MKRACLNCQHEFESLSGSVCPDDGGMLIPLKTDPLIGTTLDNKYEILEVLGGGGMGVVYKARHKLMNRIVAIKMLHKFLVSTGESLRRFQNEAQVASCLKHPNILTVYDFGVSNEGQPFMVMDYLEGVSLCELLDREGHLSVRRALNIFIQTCQGLSHAHDNGVLHRDLKPSNIMLITVEDEPDFVKIVDFGVAKLLANGAAAEKSGADRPGLKIDLTKTGEVFGSPLYMSPEQCRAKETDQRSDVYAMGCLIYRALTGSPVFQETELLQLLFKQISNLPKPFNEACVHFDGLSEIEKIAFKAMAKAPADRYQTMAELGRALKDLQQQLDYDHDISMQMELHDSSERIQAKSLLNDMKIASEPALIKVKTAEPTVARAKTSENFSPEPSRQPRISAVTPGTVSPESFETSDSLPVIDALSNSIHFAVGLSPESGKPVIATIENPPAPPPEAPLSDFTNRAREPRESRERRAPGVEALRMKKGLHRQWPDTRILIGVALGLSLFAGAVAFALLNNKNDTKTTQPVAAERFDSNKFDKEYKKAILLCRQNKFSEAVQVVSGAIAEAKKLGAPGQDLGDSLSLRAKAYLDQGNFAKSESDARNALAVCQTAKGENNLATAACQSELARVLLSSARFSEAEPLLQKAGATEMRLNAPDEQKSTTLLDLAICEMKQNRKVEAKEDLEKAIALLPPDSPSLSAIRHEFPELLKFKNDGEKVAASSERPRSRAAHLPSMLRRHAYSTYGQ